MRDACSRDQAAKSGVTERFVVATSLPGVRGRDGRRRSVGVTLAEDASCERDLR